MTRSPRAAGSTGRSAPPSPAAPSAGAVGSQVLDCTFASLAPAASVGPIHLVSETSGLDCGTVSNTATAASGNDGGAQATASVDVQCPSLSIVKTAVNDSISAGEVASFKIVVSNAGPGAASDVVISDTLPTGIDWAVDDTTDCSISAGVLTCTFDTIAAGDDATVTISGETEAADCGSIENTATVTASNEGAPQVLAAADLASRPQQHCDHHGQLPDRRHHQDRR